MAAPDPNGPNTIRVWWRPARPGTSGAGLPPGEDDPGDLQPLECTCGRDERVAADPLRPGIGLHSITCMVSAATQPHAMVNDAGGVFYPDGPGDAVWFAEHEGARFLNPTAAAELGFDPALGLPTETT